MSSPTLSFHHVDVFTRSAYSGNSLAVFPDAAGLAAGQMLSITQELRHFESIFLQPGSAAGHYQARIFDLIEELPFAGHPVIGAACVLHATTGTSTSAAWEINLLARRVSVTTERRDDHHFNARLNQGPAEFIASAAAEQAAEIAGWFGLSADDSHPDFRPEVISTGLRYLIVPLKATLPIAKARIAVADLGERLAALGAQFAYLLDVDCLEGRHWNNDGIIEDVATGSGAGCAAAFLRRHGRIGEGRPATLRQGRFAGRPSEITLVAHGAGTDLPSIEIGGSVSLVGTGLLYADQIRPAA